MELNPYQSPAEVGHEREGWIRAGLHLALAWIWMTLLSLLGVWFLLVVYSNCAELFAVRPVKAAMQLLGGTVLGCGFLWTNYVVLQRARRKYRESMEPQQNYSG